MLRTRPRLFLGGGRLSEASAADLGSSSAAVARRYGENMSTRLDSLAEFGGLRTRLTAWTVPRGATGPRRARLDAGSII